MMADAENSVEPEESIEVKTRLLELDECHALHTWLTALPGILWTPEDAQRALDHFLESRRALVTLPARMTREILYCKVKWG